MSFRGDMLATGGDAAKVAMWSVMALYTGAAFLPGSPVDAGQEADFALPSGSGEMP
jgi:hypothetical protein